MELSGPLMVQELDSRAKKMPVYETNGSSVTMTASAKSVEPTGFVIELDGAEQRGRRSSHLRNFV